MASTGETKYRHFSLVSWTAADGFSVNINEISHREGVFTLRATDEKIIAALLSCSTNRAAAAEVGLSERQLYTRMKQPAFRAKLNETKMRILEAATVAAQGRMTEAVAVMADIMGEDENAPQVRLNAAEAIIRNGMKLTEQTDILSRLDALEARQND